MLPKREPVFDIRYWFPIIIPKRNEGKMTNKNESPEQARPGLSIVIPVYNEEESLPFLVEKLASTIASMSMPSEIILVDDGSVDSSLKEMKKLKREICPEIRIIEFAQNRQGPVVIDFRVEKEEAVYPMVPAGADLDVMIRRPIRREPVSGD